MLPLALLLLAITVSASAAELEGINHAETCGRCHRDILRAWKTSAHAKAMENPLFQDVLAKAEEKGGPSARRTCIGCHSPTVQYSSDWSLNTKASWEGVTCDFCHSIKSVRFEEGVSQLRVEFDGVKTGPLRDASSMAHGTAFSPIHTSSLVCVDCHEYRNSQGFPVLTTYTEWENSSYGQENTHCQECHMGETAANVVDPKVKRLSQTTVNLHEMPGSRSIDQLNKAVSLRMRPTREEDELVVRVEVANRGAGHAVPTGSPLRRMSLVVSVQSSDGRSLQEERRYERRVADSSGTEIHSEEEVFLNAAKTLSDTRLQPGETRQEVFRFSLPTSQSARLIARLSYYYSAHRESAEATSVNFLTLPAYVPRRNR